MPGAEAAARLGGALAAVLAAGAFAAGAQAEEVPQRRPIPVPSGQEVRLAEAFLEPQQTADELWIRFRFVAPAIAPGPGAVPFAAAAQDMAHLCDAYVMPILAARGLAPDLVVISLADRPTAFGQTDPGTTQYFEAFTIADGRCQWAPF